MKNRRNYYRLLHVQPDAPIPVIKSSYHAVMLKLKQHPDLGGDTDTAALLNEAYAVLTDPARRAAYDRELQSRVSKAAAGAGPLTREPSEPAPASSVRVETAGDADASGPRCPFCDTPHPAAVAAGRRCITCQSPLAHAMTGAHAGSDKRGMPRIARGGELVVQDRHSVGKIRVRIHDLSPSGICIIAPDALAVGEVLRLEGSTLAAVARVVSCRRDPAVAGRQPLIGLEFLTLEFTENRGSLLNVRT